MSRELVARIAAAAKRHVIDLDDVFEAADRTHHGLLPMATFTQALASTHLHFTQNDLQQIQTAYLKDGKINYRKFVQDLQNPQPSLLSQRSETNLNLLIEFGLKILGEGLTVTDILEQHDRYRTGRVSANTFFRAFGLADNVKNIARQYTDDLTQEINYTVLEEDVQNALKRRNETQVLACPLPAFFDSFAASLAARGIDVEGHLFLADRYHRGVLTVQSFMSVVSSWRCGLSPVQLQALAQPFVVGGQVNYQLFWRTVRPLIELRSPLRDATVSQSAAPRVPVTPTDLGVLLDEIKSRVAVRRLPLRERLESESNGDPISRLKFYTILRFCGFSLSPADIQALDTAFALPDELFNATAFLDSVDPLVPAAPPIDPDDVVNRLKDHLATHNLSLVKSLVSFDRERSGVVSVAQAISAFYAVDFRPSTAEMSAVAQKFGNGRLVNWRALCAVVEPPPAPEKADSPENTKPEPAPEVVEFLRRVYQAVKRCGATLRSEFLKVDIRKSGILTAQVFKSVLDGLSIRSSASEIIVLLRPYFQGKTEMIEYPAFCEDLELFGKTPAPAPRTAPKSFDREENKEKSERALRLFKAALVSRRLNGEELFVAHDPARMGTVLTTTLRPATKSINALLSEETLQQIEKDFRDQRQPERFNYRRLCATLASVHPTEEDVAQVAEQRIQSCGEREGSEPIVVAIKGKLAERRKSIYDVFASVVDDFMPVTQFRNRVSAAGIYLSEAEVQKLTWKYKTGRKNEIDWRAFCDDVHESCPI